MRFSDSQYYLPQIEALRANRVMSSGTTLPMSLEGVDRVTGVRDQFVVKFVKSPRMSPASSAKELIAAWVAMELDLPVVDPVIIHISQPFVESMRGYDGFIHASQSLGENYGSRYKAGFEELLAGQKFSGKMETDALRIFGFDLFVTNSDRGHQKNNVNTNGEEFLIFDHELSFSHVTILPFLRTKTPWIVLDHEKTLYQKHVFYPYLKGKVQDFSTFASDLQRIDDAFWQKVETLLPTAWNTSEVGEIRAYLTEIVNHRDEFADQLTQSLL
ncbi:MAG: hypothetical protein KGZ90_12535 [Algoriphagus sp.]|nr:hypothetical protein [Algoriphagus sp.]